MLFPFRLQLLGQHQRSVHVQSLHVPLFFYSRWSRGLADSQSCTSWCNRPVNNQLRPQVVADAKSYFTPTVLVVNCEHYFDFLWWWAFSLPPMSSVCRVIWFPYGLMDIKYINITNKKPQYPLHFQLGSCKWPLKLSYILHYDQNE